MEVKAWTDGSCTKNPGPGGWAFIIQHPKKEYTDSGNGGVTTNNRMEMQAVLSCMQFAKDYKLVGGGDSLKIHTDSMYVVKGMNNWIFGWKEHNWKTKGTFGKTTFIKNRDLWEVMDSLRNEMTVEFVYVPAHVGEYYNERCDVMAKKAAKRP